MRRHRQLSPEAIQFRDLVIDVLWDEEAFFYVNEDHFIGLCPVCGYPVGVHFHGFAPRATLNCHGGCTEAEIAQLVGLQVRP